MSASASLSGIARIKNFDKILEAFSRARPKHDRSVNVGSYGSLPKESGQTVPRPQTHSVDDGRKHRRVE